MTFGQALDAMKEGLSVFREAEPDYVYRLQQGHFLLLMPNKKPVNVMFISESILAEDWEIDFDGRD